MSRSRISPIRQPDEDSCGPAALKIALTVLGKRTSIAKLIDLCESNKNRGTSTKKMIGAIKKLGLPALVVENTTLHHVLSALRTSFGKKRVIIVSYLYDMDIDNNPLPNSGHWAVVRAFHPATGRIELMDSYTGGKISYPWVEFRRRWIDETLKRRKTGRRSNKFKLIHTPERQLMIVVSKEKEDLPSFQISSSRLVASRSIN